MSLAEIRDNDENLKEELLHQRVSVILRLRTQKKSLTREEKIIQLLDMNDVLFKLNSKEAELSQKKVPSIEGQKQLPPKSIGKIIQKIMKKRDKLQKELFSSDIIKKLSELNCMVVNNLKDLLLIPISIEEYKQRNDQTMLEVLEYQYQIAKQQLDIKIKERIDMITGEF